MKVRVERIRRGQRTPVVEYVEASRPRKRKTIDLFKTETTTDDPWGQQEGVTQRLRLPWRINSSSD